MRKIWFLNKKRKQILSLSTTKITTVNIQKKVRKVSNTILRTRYPSTAEHIFEWFWSLQFHHRGVKEGNKEGKGEIGFLLKLNFPEL